MKGIIRKDLQKFLAEKNIPAMIYYPVPLHLQKVFSNGHYKKGDLPVSENLSECVLSLPMHTELTLQELEYITQSVLEFVNA